MYCPNCGKSDQKENTYCRQCGEFLPDFEAKQKLPKTPAEQFQLSLVFNCLSALAAFSMAIVLYIFHFGNPDTHFTIYMAASLFTVIGAWQTVSFFNNLKLKRRFVRKEKETGEDLFEEKIIKYTETKELLPEADFENIIPTSVTESTTRKLKNKR
jgi:hypothetical protein